ncbi:MAG: N-acetylmuramate alpha-1-phosphate uridylyltransferase MurU [Leucothrix sp.]
MILAAGLGTRMRPLTNHLPKPLLSVGGKPLIVWHLERLQRNGFRDIVINIAWLGYKIPEMLGNGEQFGVSIHYSDEQDEPALETAGGVIKALPLLGDEPFLVISSDIWCDFEFAPISPLKNDDLSHIVLVDNPKHHPKGDFSLEGSRVYGSGASQLTYGGIAYFHPALFAKRPYGSSALAPIMREAMQAGRVSGEHHRGVWQDIGTPERLAAFDRDLKLLNQSFSL